MPPRSFSGSVPQDAKSLCNLPGSTGVLGFVDAEKQVGWGGGRESSGHFYDIICKCCANKMQIKTECSSTAQRWCRFAFNFSSVQLRASWTHPWSTCGAGEAGNGREKLRLLWGQWWTWQWVFLFDAWVKYEVQLFWEELMRTAFTLEFSLYLEMSEAWEKGGEDLIGVRSRFQWGRRLCWAFLACLENSTEEGPGSCLIQENISDGKVLSRRSVGELRPCCVRPRVVSTF